ncbi:unnamed protein product [Lymnaea stagnalis]|uniref:BTB domain-containing protein n=1 Tax=Lymnaea stagnalis TaxID=6523 RepID=A0AAV2IKE2_LYMST
MVIHKDVGFGIIESIESLWEAQELFDFTVEVEHHQIKCHRFILGACSKFFGGLFRSGMKESSNRVAVLKDVSLATFQLILTSLYTGSDVVTKSNVVAIWHASNQLQIDFLITRCEKKIVKWMTLKNLETIYKNAKLLDSKKVLNSAFEFMLSNFERIIETPLLLELPFSDLLFLVDNENLKVRSEHLVVDSILKWVECSKEACYENYSMCPFDEEGTLFLINTSLKEESDSSVDCDVQTGQADLTASREYCEIVSNELPKDIVVKSSGQATESQVDASSAIRREVISESGLVSRVNETVSPNSRRTEMLVELLKAARTCLTSLEYLNSLEEHPLLMNNVEAKEIVSSAVQYHKAISHHWPKAATHILKSKQQHFAVYMINSGIKAISLAEFKTYFLLDDSSYIYHGTPSIAVLDDEIYLCRQGMERETSLFLFKGNRLTAIQKEMRIGRLWPHENSFYAHDIDRNLIVRISPKGDNKDADDFTSLPPNVRSIMYSVSFNKKLLLFCQENERSLNETCVHSLDVSTKTWTTHGEFHHNARSMISFRDNTNTYILHNGGQLWTVIESCDGTVKFKLMGKLWKNYKTLNGTIFYHNELVIFGTNNNGDPPDINKLVYPSETFTKIRFCEVESGAGQLFPLVLSKTDLKTS